MIESGDTGKVVEVWQKIVGTTEDGEFGPKTKAATIAFQKAYQLEVDGIAGPESWRMGLETLKRQPGIDPDCKIFNHDLFYLVHIKIIIAPIISIDIRVSVIPRRMFYITVLLICFW